MLKERAEQTGDHLHEGVSYLTPRFFGLPGLNVGEEKGDLWIQFWASAFGRHKDERTHQCVLNRGSLGGLEFFAPRFGLW
jgi:hypothetical protein